MKSRIWFRANEDYLKELKEKQEREAKLREEQKDKPEKKVGRVLGLFRKKSTGLTGIFFTPPSLQTTYYLSAPPPSFYNFCLEPNPLLTFSCQLPPPHTLLNGIALTNVCTANNKIDLLNLYIAI